MSVAAASDTSHESYEGFDLTRVKSAHVQLMRAYVNSLAAASLVGRSDEHKESSFVFVSGLLVRWLVGSHIRRNLMTLGTVYLELEQTFMNDDSNPVDPWLPKAKEGCLALAERLPRIRLPGVIGVVSASVALAGLLSKLPGWAGALFLGLAIGAAISLWAPYATMRSSYLYKRTLFLRDAMRVDKEKIEDQKAVHNQNIYALENEVFDALHIGKQRETEIDKQLAQITLSLLLYIAVGLTLWADHLKPRGSFLVVSFAGLFICILWILRINRKRRVWL